MGMITKQIMIAGSKSQRQCEVLFDTGASTCFVREAIASELEQILKSPFPLASKLGNNTVMIAEKTTNLFIDLKGYHISSMFLVTPDLPYEVIVGADFF